MEVERKKISTNQLFIISIVGITSALIRVLPLYTSEIVKKATILSQIFAIIPLAILIFTLNRMFKNNPNKSLDEIFEMTIGKTFGKILTIIYMIWVFSAFAIYLRFFAERFLTSILPYAQIEFFIMVMLFLTYIVVTNNIEIFARTTEILFIIFLLVLFISFIIIVPEVELINIYPLTTYNVYPAIMGITPVLSIFSYITFFFFAGNDITHKEEIKKYGIKAIILLTVIDIMVVLSTIGIFGYKLTQEFPLPFFMALKQINILQTFERIEAGFISLWVINDFVILTMIMYTLKSLVSKVFNTNSKNSLITPIILLAYIFSLYIANNQVELEFFSQYFAININLILGFVIPIIITCILIFKEKYKKSIDI